MTLLYAIEQLVQVFLHKQAQTVLAYSMPQVMGYLPLLAVRQEALCMCPTASLSLGLGTRTPGSTYGRYEAH